MLEDRAFLRPEGTVPSSRTVAPADPSERIWVDPSTRVYHGCQRGVIWLDFRGGDTGGIDIVTAAEAPLG